YALHCRLSRSRLEKTVNRRGRHPARSKVRVELEKAPLRSGQVSVSLSCCDAVACPGRRKVSPRNGVANRGVRRPCLQNRSGSGSGSGPGPETTAWPCGRSPVIPGPPETEDAVGLGYGVRRYLSVTHTHTHTHTQRERERERGPRTRKPPNIKARPQPESQHAARTRSTAEGGRWQDIHLRGRDEIDRETPVTDSQLAAWQGSSSDGESVRENGNPKENMACGGVAKFTGKRMREALEQARPSSRTDKAPTALQQR
ncbi:hypothetical protein CLAIMM_03397, partial [Cladophialophora immunda]